MNSKEWKIGMSSFCFDSLDKETFYEYRKNGIDCMEISLSQDKYDTINWKSLEKNSKENRVELWSFHLPFSNAVKNNIASSDKAIRDSALSVQSECIKRIGSIGIKIAVIHPSGEPNFPNEREKKLNLLQKA